jgi:Chlorophyll A-B binding protein
MTNTTPTDTWFQNRASEQIHLQQLKTAERFNGRAAMLGIVIGILTEAITGSGIAHQIGLGPLIDGFAACQTRFLPFCF